MIRVDYTQLDREIPHLSLARAGSGYIVWDQQCRFYILAPSSLETCLRFMQAMERKGDATIDDQSVERATWHSVRVPALDAGEATPVRDDGTSPASNVVPIRKDAA